MHDYCVVLTHLFLSPSFKHAETAFVSTEGEEERQTDAAIQQRQVV